MAPRYQPAPAVHRPLLAVRLLQEAASVTQALCDHPTQASPHPSPSLAPQSLTCSQIHGAFRAVPSRKDWGRLETLSRSALPHGRLGLSSAAFRDSGCHLSSCTEFSLLKVFFPSLQDVHTKFPEVNHRKLIKMPNKFRIHLQKRTPYANDNVILLLNVIPETPAEAELFKL